MRSGPKVGFAIVQAVAIDVVNQKGLRHIQDLAVQPDGELFFAVPDLALGVVGASALGGVPFIFGQAWIVVGVHDSVLVLREGDPSEGVAEAQAPVAQSEPDGNACQPSWDFDSDDQSQDAFSGVYRSEFTTGGIARLFPECLEAAATSTVWGCSCSGTQQRPHNGTDLRKFDEISAFFQRAGGRNSLCRQE